MTFPPHQADQVGGRWRTWAATPMDKSGHRPLHQEKTSKMEVPFGLVFAHVWLVTEQPWALHHLCLQAVWDSSNASPTSSSDQARSELNLYFQTTILPPSPLSLEMKLISQPHKNWLQMGQFKRVCVLICISLGKSKTAFDNLLGNLLWGMQMNR